MSGGTSIPNGSRIFSKAEYWTMALLQRLSEWFVVTPILLRNCRIKSLKMTGFRISTSRSYTSLSIKSDICLFVALRGHFRSHDPSLMSSLSLWTVSCRGRANIEEDLMKKTTQSPEDCREWWYDWMLQVKSDPRNVCAIFFFNFVCVSEGGVCYLSHMSLLREETVKYHTWRSMSDTSTVSFYIHSPLYKSGNEKNRLCPWVMILDAWQLLQGVSHTHRHTHRHRHTRTGEVNENHPLTREQHLHFKHHPTGKWHFHTIYNWSPGNFQERFFLTYSSTHLLKQGDWNSVWGNLSVFRGD